MLPFKVKKNIDRKLKGRGYSSMSILTVIMIFILQTDVAAQTVNATSSLPAGCAECTGSPTSPAVNITETNNSAYCGTNYGVTSVDGTDPHSYTLSASPCFNNDEWKALLSSVSTTVGITRSCPNNPATVLCSGGVAGLTKTQACAQLAKYPSPLTQADLFTAAFESDCWCRDCVARHEEAHMNIDWVQDSLQPEINTFIAFLNNNGVAVDCGVASTLNCSTVITAAVKSGYDTEWQTRITAAVNTWNSSGEGPNGYAAEIACYQAIINALTANCSAP